MTPIQLSTILRAYEKKWVALNREKTRVIASGDSVKEVAASAKKSTGEKPIIFFVSPFNLDYVG